MDILINKILKQEEKYNIEDVKVDLKRVIAPNFGYDNADLGYVNFLLKYYQNEINYIDSIQTLLSNNCRISVAENIRNYLIKIAIIRICRAKGISVIIEKMNDLNYCRSLF